MLLQNLPQKSTFISVTIPCKKVVKAYLEANFGTPVNIPEDHILHKLACSNLDKKNSRPVSGGIVSKYHEAIELSLRYNQFRYDGFNMDGNARRFNDAVDSYIKTLCRTNLDSLLIAQDKQREWKKRFNEMLRLFKGEKEARKYVRTMREELEHNELSIKAAIETVIYDVLKLDTDVLAYDTVKKDYYRYRNKKVFTLMSPDVN